MSFLQYKKENFHLNVLCVHDSFRKNLKHYVHIFFYRGHVLHFVNVILHYKLAYSRRSSEPVQLNILHCDLTFQSK